MEEIALPEKDASAVQGNDSADPLGLFPEPPTSDFPQVFLVHFALHLLETNFFVAATNCFIVLAV